MVLLLVLLSTIAALGLSEGVLAAWGPRPTYRAYWRTSLPYFELDPLYLYRVQPRASGEFNSAGYRGPEFPPKSARKRLLALGDSFFMGLNVAEQETLPSALGDGYEVLNLGVYGYGPDQLLARYRAEGRALDADGVLLGIYAENDFNDLYKNRVFVYAEDGSLTPNAKNPVRNALPPTHLELFLRRAFTGHYLEPSREQELATLLLSDTRDLLALEVAPVKQTKVFMMRSVLRAFAVDLRTSSVPLFVIVLPSLANVQDPDILARLGVSPEDAFLNETTVARLAAGAHSARACMGIEVKASARFDERDLAGLHAFLATTSGARAAVLAYNGEQAVSLGDRLFAVPLSMLLS